MIDLEDYKTQPEEYEEMERDRILKIIDGFIYGDDGCSKKCVACFVSLKQKIEDSQSD